MMSQNRQEEKDRQRAENDYYVNLKTELIIGDLHRKIDDIIDRQEKLQRSLEELEKKWKGNCSQADPTYARRTQVDRGTACEI